MISLKKHLDQVLEDQFQASLYAYARALTAMGQAAEILAEEDGKPLHERLATIQLELVSEAEPKALRQTGEVVEQEVDRFARQRAEVRARKEHEYKQIIRIVADASVSLAESGLAQSTELLTFAARIERVSEIESIAEIRKQLAIRVVELKAIAARVHAQGEANARSLQDKLLRAEAKLQTAEVTAQTDPLTGLGNRRKAERAIEAAIADKSPFVVILFDLDGFKLVNDRFGHSQGDCLLKSVADGLRSSVRADDTVCRWGGDEFLVLCPRTSLADAQQRAARLQEKAFGEFMLEQGGNTIRLNLCASMGIAQYREGESAQELFDRADQILYEQKAPRKKGRERIPA